MFNKKATEISDLKERLKNVNKELYEEIYARNKSDMEKLSQINDLETQNQKLKGEIDDLQQKIKIMEKYYDLDKEPTDEEKIKIRIDLKVHELEMEILKEKLSRIERAPLYRFITTGPNRLY